MPLTPEDVSNKRFTTVRLREGYDMTEVDQFLDEVEAALSTLTRENDELRSKLQTAHGGEPVPDAVLTPVATAPPVEEPEPAAEEPAAEEAAEPVAEVEPEPVPSPVDQPVETTSPAQAEPVRATSVETLQVTTTAEASVAAARLLELAGRNADELVLESRQQAEDIVNEARTTADSLESEAQERAAALEAETEQRRQSLFGDIEREKADLDAEISSLRTFEREYRTQLKSYFEQQLEALDGHGEGGSLAEPLGQRETEPGSDPSTVQESDRGSQGEVSRLQAILAEDDDQDQDQRQD